jgi:hypothetical protein
MASRDKPVSQVTPAGPLTGTELVYVNQAGYNRRTTTGDIANLAGGGGGGGVVSVNGKFGPAIVLVPTDIGAATAAQGDLAESALQSADLAAVALSGQYNDLLGKPTLGSAALQNSTAFASAAQGVKADTALQPAGVAAVALTGNYLDLSNRPTLGTASQYPVSAFATSAQGVKADSAVQSGDLADIAFSGSYNDLTDVPPGGGGTNDYNDLINKPTANDISADRTPENYSAINSTIKAHLQGIDSELSYRARRVAVPASSTSQGETGDYAVDTEYAYYCVAINSWVRVPVSTF